MACLVMALLTFVTWQEELWSLFQRGKQGRSYGLSALDISIAIETVIMEDVDRSSVDSIPAFKVPLQQLPQPKNIDDSLRTKAAMGVDWAE